jgi:protein tyrosine phosphatase
LADFQPKVPELQKMLMLMELASISTKQCFGPNGNQTKISSFRYYEFWMDCALPELFEVMKRVDVIQSMMRKQDNFENILCCRPKQL